MRVFIVSAYISLHIFLSYLPDTLTSFTVFCGVGVMDILGLEDVVVTVSGSGIRIKDQARGPFLPDLFLLAIHQHTFLLGQAIESNQL